MVILTQRYIANDISDTTGNNKINSYVDKLD